MYRAIVLLYDYPCKIGKRSAWRYWRCCWALWITVRVYLWYWFVVSVAYVYSKIGAIV
jgi:hypothetical protein